MKTKLAACIFALVVMLGFSAAAMADPIQDFDTVYLTGGSAVTWGGPFDVYEVGEVELHFQTFCLERNEHLATGVQYTATIDDGAIYGGYTGGPYDQLDDQTAYLYVKFLSGYSFNNDALQVAIWKLEGEYDFAATVFDSLEPTAQLYIDMDRGGWTNNGKIQVMNLWENREARQSVLIPVPEPMTVLLLGFGLLGLGITSRKLKK